MGHKPIWLAPASSGSFSPAEGAAFRAAVGQDGALASPVPSCPDWTVQDLVQHLGWIYRFVAGQSTDTEFTFSRPQPPPIAQVRAKLKQEA